MFLIIKCPMLTSNINKDLDLKILFFLVQQAFTFCPYFFITLYTMGWAQIYEPYFLRSRAHAKKSVVINSVVFIEIIEGDLNWTRKGSGSTLRSTKKSILQRPWGCLNDKICVFVFTKGQKLIKLLKKIFPSWFILL